MGVFFVVAVFLDSFLPPSIPRSLPPRQPHACPRLALYFWEKPPPNRSSLSPPCAAFRIPEPSRHCRCSASPGLCRQTRAVNTHSPFLSSPPPAPSPPPLPPSHPPPFHIPAPLPHRCHRPLLAVLAVRCGMEGWRDEAGGGRGGEEKQSTPGERCASGVVNMQVAYF